MSEWVEGQLEAGADGAADGADEGTLESPGPQAGAELGLTDDANSFEPEEADPAVTADDEPPDPADG